jgi:pyruvate formate-lyase/glycerol dehydratase family glycyl radical enzyme
MSLSSRVQKLRRQSLQAKPSLSSERAELVTDFYRRHSGQWPFPLLRARTFEHLLAHQSICINPGELIIGEKGPTPQSAPTFPELCCHSLQDLSLLDTRLKIPFAVSGRARQVYEKEIIPFWQGRSMRDKIFTGMTPEWRAAYDAGIFTEFMEQRAPGHTVLDDKIYHKGMLDFIQEIDAALSRPAFEKDPQVQEKRYELEAMRICAGALIRFAERHADLAMQLAGTEKDGQRKAELQEIARLCQKVPAHAPASFREALQYYWFVHLGVTIELNTWDSFSPGHLDQHLYPFYKTDIGNGSLTQDEARQLLQCFWIKFNNQPAPPKVGVTAAESGTYTDFCQINLGGLRPDGSDAVNDVTYLLLDVIEEMRLLQPSASIQVSHASPDQFILRALEIIRTGFGQPSVFNADAIVQELLRQGKSLPDARQGGSSGCVEVGAFGRENYNLTGYFNLPKILELTLNDGLDPRTGQQLGLHTGAADRFGSFTDLMSAYRKQLEHFIDIKIAGNTVIEHLYAEEMPAPFLSLLIDDCIPHGSDYHAGGARYNTSYIQGVGLGSITDELSAIRFHVFDRKRISMADLLAALRSDFSGQENLRQILLNKTPKYGNDDDYPDQIMQAVFEMYFAAIDGRPNYRGGQYHINLLPTTCHVYFGSVIGAMPDGRPAGKPLSEGISAVQGADRLGPTAVLRSVAKMDHLRTGGTLLNMKFTPDLLKDAAGLEHVLHLVRTYFRLNGHHVQFNVVSAETLRDAMQHPSQHRDLIVRVAGYSDYFCNLSESLQEEIITRTEHACRE